MKFGSTSAESFKKTAMFTSQLKECWGEYGVGHKNCLQFVQGMDASYEQETEEFINYRQHMAQYPKMLSKHLFTMKDPKKRKGRKAEPVYAHKTQGYGKNYKDNF